MAGQKNMKLHTFRGTTYAINENKNRSKEFRIPCACAVNILYLYFYTYSYDVTITIIYVLWYHGNIITINCEYTKNQN